jgi:hypothetical protein
VVDSLKDAYSNFSLDTLSFSNDSHKEFAHRIHQYLHLQDDNNCHVGMLDGCWVRVLVAAYGGYKKYNLHAPGKNRCYPLVASLMESCFDLYRASKTRIDFSKSVTFGY